MKRFKWFFLLSFLSVVLAGLPFTSWSQEEDSFWDEEFFQEEPLSRLEEAHQLVEKKDWKGAIESFEKMIESPLDKGEYEEALLGLAQVYEGQGKIKVALGYYRTLKRKTEDEDKKKIAKDQIEYYESYILDQFHIGEWYPKLWFYEKTSALAAKYPKHQWFFKDGAYPIVLIIYKFILISFLILFVLLLTRKGKEFTQPFDISWGLPAIYLIYSIFLVLQLYLVFLLKPAAQIEEGSVVAFDVVSILSYFILIAAVLLFFTFRGIPWRRLGFDWDHLGHHLVLTLKYLVILAILFGIIAFLRFNGFIEQDKIFRSYSLSSVGGFLYIFQFILLVFVAPVSEEIFYRGFIYPVVRNRLGILVGIIVTSLFFALVHASSFLLLFSLSFFLCFTYEKNRSLIPAILVHAFYNFWVRFGGSLLPGQ